MFNSDTNILFLDKYNPNIIYGDVNGDGKVSVLDLAQFQRYLNGWDVTVVEIACDVNADGLVNIRDFGLIQQYLNGWDVELILPQ